MHTRFLMFCLCFRCSGYAGAFQRFAVNDGRCLRCNGALRERITKPLARLAEFYPDARARSIATLTRCLALTGAPMERDARGRKVSPWGFPTHRAGDNELVLIAALTIAPADVRARFWRAFVTKVRATLPTRADKILASMPRLTCHYAGLAPEDFAAWIGETAAQSCAA